MEQFQAIARPVQKHKNLSVARIPSQPMLYKAAQAIKAFAHIAGLSVQMVTMGGAQAEHT